LGFGTAKAAFSGDAGIGSLGSREGPKQHGACVMPLKTLLRITGASPERISNVQLRSRLCFRCHWLGGLCRHGALSERLRQLVRAAMTFDTTLGAIVTAVVMIYLVIALIRPERF